MKEIKLGGKEGSVVLVDDEDYEWLSEYSWYPSGHGYAQTNIRLSKKKYSKYKPERMHVAVWKHCFGLVPKGQCIDHKNRDRSNNQKENLRLVFPSVNTHNQKLRAHSSRYKGVFFAKTRGKWTAQIRAEGKRRHLGMFTDEREAALAYDAAAIKFHGGFACTNFQLEI